MIKNIKFNKINENYVSEYEYKIINNDTLEIVKIGYIENINNGPTIHTKTLDYQENNIYFIDEHIYYNDIYDISVYINGNLINKDNIDYNVETKCFYINNHINNINNINNNILNNTKDVKDIKNINNINVVYYKNIIEKELYIPENCKIVVKPIIKNNHFIGNHNILY